ncbi:hypothetical protein M0805_002309 [Coniferiporia weirii]|nr:hypothetical protein M0805_002309 [Coniferiporia weirii]
MNLLISGCLTVLHALHTLWACLVALLYQPFVANPQPLEAQRPKLPTNMALILSTTSDEPADSEAGVVVESVVCAVRCCRKVGIKSLSVYTRHGSANRYADRIKMALARDVDRIPPDSECSSDASDVECPPTPLLSDSSDSRPTTPESCISSPSLFMVNHGVDIPRIRQSPVRRHLAKNGLRPDYRDKTGKPPGTKLSLVSYEASKPFMATLARTFAESRKAVKGTNKEEADEVEIGIRVIDDTLLDTLRLPPPDLMIVHPLEQPYLCCPPLELHGFPPWIMRVTEIFYDERPSLSRAWKSRGNKRTLVAFPEETFRRALDQYTHAELRMGK